VLLQGVAVCCRVLQCVAGCCSVLQGVAWCCSVLQSVAVCCSVLQCVACLYCLAYPAACGTIVTPVAGPSICDDNSSTNLQAQVCKLILSMFSVEIGQNMSNPVNCES